MKEKSIKKYAIPAPDFNLFSLFVLQGRNIENISSFYVASYVAYRSKPPVFLFTPECPIRNLIISSEVCIVIKSILVPWNWAPEATIWLLIWLLLSDKHIRLDMSKLHSLDITSEFKYFSVQRYLDILKGIDVIYWYKSSCTNGSQKHRRWYCDILLHIWSSRLHF